MSTFANLDMDFIVFLVYALFRDHPAKQATSLLLRIQSKRGDKMGQDTIQTIRDAEEKADQIERQAEAECAALLAQARSQAKEETDKALAKARADNQQALHQAREKADKTLEQALASVESEIRAMQANAAAKKEEAIRMILSELI